jgi:hypothetical protein
MALNLGLARDLPAGEFSKRSDAAWRAAFEEVRARRSVGIGVGVPAARSNHYARKNMVAVTFVKLEDRIERGTILASRDGSAKCAFSVPAKKLTIEPESTGDLILAGMPRSLCSWVNVTFPKANLGWPGVVANFAGDWTEDQRSTYGFLMEVANLTNNLVDRARRPPPRNYGKGYTGSNPW